MTDNFVQSRYSYWNALITLNGIFLSVFSAIIITDMERISIYFYGIIMLSLFSIWLLLSNYRTYKIFFFEVGKISDQISNLSSEKIKFFEEESITKNLRRHRSTNIRETIVEIFFILETLLIIMIIYSNEKFGIVHLLLLKGL